ncbi:DUF6907 domain-containing protein [Streptomyces parvus]|uniref:DUF6907 domain-containing protein n=1 Tax=Streptomyces TaxID=1883 RepID=UPI000C270727|nr:hypothetical protein [Streptomyces sp. CB02613]PJN26497.1 hypothetical protein CG717_29275 [Streptomyces sp. CB02613]
MSESESRMVTVPTVDHGDVTTAEPDWCLGHVDARPEYRCDTGHMGAAQEATYCGYELAFAALAQDPFAELGSREVGTVEMGGLPRRMGPAELRELAAVLVDYAETLNDLAVRLTTLRAER